MIKSLKKLQTTLVSAVIFGSALTVFSNSAHALPNASAIPGGVAIIEVPADTEQAWFRNKPLFITRENGKTVALVGIPLSQQPGNAELTITSKSSGQKITQAFSINDYAYKEQRIKLTGKKKKYVSPSKEQLARFKREKKLSRQAFASFSSQIPDTNFDLPVTAPVSSPFGLKRFFNDQPRKPHSGLDLAAPKGTAIKAPSAGTVVLTGDFFFNGKSVYIDHGQGLVTMYCHMSEIGVKKGQVIARGEALGKVGATGRVTGPHLHWTVGLNGYSVSPELFLKQAN
ncbi:peptidoglycan DD-metalloendopeptidase family protein [Pelagibaculum spongiae]|uniref:Peptidase M23 n=1 Tax=Pelagibaculum spongiae TaxID=2080658 RepID=A0A2V1H6D9_9GAMM|nr:peptidoglycan DD-metalloendopeptidase family protein [Pelagibaculum spongiae]PVZ72325.1 peptidase M23 [Pelagibaculum spongiae]